MSSNMQTTVVAKQPSSKHLVIEKFKSDELVAKRSFSLEYIKNPPGHYIENEDLLGQERTK